MLVANPLLKSHYTVAKHSHYAKMRASGGGEAKARPEI